MRCKVYMCHLNTAKWLRQMLSRQEYTVLDVETPSTLWKVDKVNRVALAPYIMYRIGNNIDRDKMSNSCCCWFVARTSNKVDRIGNSWLRCRFVAGFGNSWLLAKSTMLNSTLSPVCTGLYCLVALLFQKLIPSSYSFTAKMSLSRSISITVDNSFAVTFPPSSCSDVDFQFGDIIAGVTHSLCSSPPPYTASSVFVRIFPEPSETSIVLPPDFSADSVIVHQ